MSKYLEKFFTVTMNSVYKVVVYGEEDCPYAEKIATNKKESNIQIGDRINNGPMLAIAKWLQFYRPEKYGMISPVTGEERRLEHVNVDWWRGRTSSIVALFLTEKEAMSCFEKKDLKACDQRWIKKTKEVIDKIDNNHPNVTICYWSDLCLIPF